MNKSPEAFRTISEVAADLDVPQHVLRFWETRFATIRPLKRGGGRRYYRPDDVDLLKGIRDLLYGQGYTIKGVQRILRQDGPRFVQAIGRGEQGVAPASPEMDDLDPQDELAAAAPDDEDGHSPHSYRAPDPSQAPAPARPAASLTADHLARLRAALDELTECERILGSLRAE